MNFIQKIKAKKKKKKKKLREYLNTSLNRKVAVWKSTVENGEKKIVYVCLAGDIIPKPKCWGVSKRDKMYLLSQGISDKPENSRVLNPEMILPFSQNRSNQPKHLSFYSIPVSIIKAYEEVGITELYEWQIECLKIVFPHLHSANYETKDFDFPLSAAEILQAHICGNKNFQNKKIKRNLIGKKEKEKQKNDVYTNKNEEKKKSKKNKNLNKSLIYCAPTSGGKTLVSEIIMLRGILFEGRRCMLVVPHIALCTERVKQLNNVWGKKTTAIRIEPFHANQGVASGWHSGVDVAVCTIEKANAIINRLLIESVICDSIGIIVIDEMHILSDPQRGFILEIMLIKILYAKRHLGADIQIVGLSATLPNVQELSAWLNADLYVTNHRPLPLNYYLKINENVFFKYTT